MDKRVSSDFEVEFPNGGGVNITMPKITITRKLIF
ncbi:hypothetical protein QFZ31_000384 [Neobacillus niacini]|nr:hypothetical protein [Neobacillus niacini]